MTKDSTSASPPRIGVVGGGAIGGYYGARLEKAGHRVAYLLRSNYEAVRAKGWEITTPTESWKIPHPEVYQTPEEMGPCDWLIISTKTTENLRWANLLPPLVHPETILVTLQNGLGNQEALHSLFPSNRVGVGLCFITLNQLEPGKIRKFTAGRVQLGPDEPFLRPLASWLEKGGTTALMGESVDEILWRKLCWNIPFNGLTIAEGGIPTDTLLQKPGMPGKVRRLMEEVRQAAACFDVPIEGAFLDRMITETIKMGAYRPSSLIDYLNRRPLEVESIWGEPLRRGLNKGVAMPQLEELYEFLLSYQHSLFS
jgi:2-dehydropantoate 2-reductase